MTSPRDAVARVQPTPAVAAPAASRINRNDAAPSRLRTWGPVVLWMGIIFILSARDGLDTGDGQKLRLDLAKLAHLAVYFVLGALLDRALATRSIRRQAWWVMVILVSYAITDEIHQAFVPGRTPLTLDLAIDAAGGLAGILAWRRLIGPWMRRRVSPSTRPPGPIVASAVSGPPAAGSDTGTALP